MTTMINPTELSLIGLSPNQLYYLWWKYLDQDLNEPFTLPLTEEEFNDLISSSWINSELELRPKTIKLFKDRNQEQKIRIDNNNDDEESELDRLAREYSLLWPTQKESGLPRIVRPSISNIKPKLKKWLTANKEYTIEDILEATRYYLNLQRKNRYQYCMGGDNFVYKFKDSALLNVVEELKSRNKSQEDNNNDDSGFIIQA